jgi:hypothetical protein
MAKKRLFILLDWNTSNFCPIGCASFDWTFNLFSIKEDVITSFFDSWAGYIKRVKKFFFEKIEPRAFKKLINNWSARRTQTEKVNFSSMRQFEELFFQSQLEGRGNFFTQRALFNLETFFSFKNNKQVEFDFSWLFNWNSIAQGTIY